MYYHYQVQLSDGEGGWYPVQSGLSKSTAYRCAAAYRARGLQARAIHM